MGGGVSKPIYYVHIEKIFRDKIQFTEIFLGKVVLIYKVDSFFTKNLHKNIPLREVNEITLIFVPFSWRALLGHSTCEK